MGDYPVKGPDEVYCRTCGAIILREAEICVHCGVRQKGVSTGSSDLSTNWITTLIVAIFFGGLGVHRFMNGKVGTGILMIVTLGGCGIWWLIDIIYIATEKFTNANGDPITRI